MECHPYLAQNELIAHCQKRGLVVTAYSPLGSPDRAWKQPDEPVLLEEPGVKKFAEKYSKSPAQIILRYRTVVREVVFGTQPSIKQKYKLEGTHLKCVREELKSQGVPRVHPTWCLIYKAGRVGPALGQVD